MFTKNSEDSRVEEALKDIYERLRPGEPKTADSSRSLLTAVSSIQSVTIWHPLAVTRQTRSWS